MQLSGSMKASSREILKGVFRVINTNVAPPESIIGSRCRRLAPAVMNMATAKAAMIMAVPISFWSMTSMITNPVKMAKGTRPYIKLSTWLPLRESQSAIYSVNASLASSLGWKVKGPSGSQRWPPLIFLPTTSTRINSTTAQPIRATERRCQRGWGMFMVTNMAIRPSPAQSSSRRNQ